MHDLLVFPYPIEDLKLGKRKIYEYEADILRNQLQRIDVFVQNSMNRPENYLKMLEYGDIVLNSLRNDKNG